MNYLNGVMTDFSIGKSLLTIDRIKEALPNTSYKKLVIADYMTISGLISIQNAFNGSDIQAMIGVKLACYEDPTKRKVTNEDYVNPFRVVKVFPRSEEGLKSIFRVLSLANTEERFYYNARCGYEDLNQLIDCIVTTGDFDGVVDMEGFNKVKSQLQPSCKLYVEFVPVNTPYWDRVNYERLQMAQCGVDGAVLSYPALYQKTEQADTLTVLNAISCNTSITAEYLPRQFIKNFAIENGLNLQEEAYRLIERLKARYGVLDAQSIVDSIEAVKFNAEPFYRFEHHSPCLPKMAEDEFAELVRLCKEGFVKRLTTEHMGYKPADLAPYRERLVYELSVLKKMGFAGYFLVVSDLVNWSKNNGVKVGCGRGSGAGSLVAFLLGITEIDPLRFDLIFERFINPERLDLPDIDLDYQSTKRHRVIEYLKARHGADRVAGISNYSTLASSSAFRDAGRIFGLSQFDMSATKLVIKENGLSLSLTESAEQVPEIDKLRNDYPEVWKHALNLEGVMRSLGQHAAGTVVAGEPLVNRAVVEKRSEDLVVNWDKRVVEDYGLIKMDILGLSTLDVIELAQKMIKERHGVDIDFLKLPLDDKKVLDLFGRGDTTAVFQFDSTGMQTLLQRLAKGGDLTFDDITTATALFRPGTLESGLTEEYVLIKQGIKKPHYEHPIMKNALSKTYGVMVYQEQIMQLARDLAGFTMAQADLLRKSIGKKDQKKMKQMKEKFISGCVSVGYIDEMRAMSLWEKIEKFALYSFNLSHSVSYSVLSYWTAWIKTYYPAEYFASQLSVVRDDKYSSLIENAQSCGVRVLPPDINVSKEIFSIRDDKTIVMPFSAVKGVSEKTALRIVEAREKCGGFTSLEHFISTAKVKNSGINKRVIENLDKAGAFAQIEPTQPPADDESRLVDQLELLGGLIKRTVKAKQVIKIKDVHEELAKINCKIKNCSACNLNCAKHVEPTIGGAKCRFVMVFDCPNKDEEDAGRMMVGKGAQYIKEVFKEHGISLSLGYFTSLVKAKKNDKFLSNAQINGCSVYLDEEVQLLDTDLIICMGSASTKHFLPEMKSPSAEVGKSFYSHKLGANVLVGLNPLQIIFDQSKFKLLEKVAQETAKILDLNQQKE